MAEENVENEAVEEGGEGIEVSKHLYRCLSCGRTFGISDLEILGKSGMVRCPYCGYNIIVKIRQPKRMTNWQAV